MKRFACVLTSVQVFPVLSAHLFNLVFDLCLYILMNKLISVSSLCCHGFNCWNFAKRLFFLGQINAVVPFLDFLLALPCLIATRCQIYWTEQKETPRRRRNEHKIPLFEGGSMNQWIFFLLWWPPYEYDKDANSLSLFDRIRDYDRPNVRSLSLVGRELICSQSSLTSSLPGMLLNFTYVESHD